MPHILFASVGWNVLFEFNIIGFSRAQFRVGVNISLNALLFDRSGGAMTY